MTTFCEIGNAQSTNQRLEQNDAIIFLGTGSSIGTPNPFLLMQSDPFSLKAAQGNPVDNKNYRCNPSLLIQYHNKSIHNQEKNIVIDVGKTFRESLIRWFPRYGVKTVDSIILTHGHADAIFGLDDVRAVQPCNPTEPMNVYLSEECSKTVSQVFYYLVPKESVEEDNVHRHVSTIAWKIIHAFVPFDVCGLTFTPIPVIHGEDLISLGFIFGENESVCYISDISRMPEETMQLLQGRNTFSLLVVDALLMHSSHPTHYSMDQAIELIMRLRPKKSRLVGMSGNFGDHEEVNLHLRNLFAEEGLDVQLAFDGLKIDLDL